MEQQIQSLVTAASRIVVIQADNPDADSLGSALALEHILGDLGKDVVLYCGVNVPDYLRYLSGWDRVVNTLPTQFDLSIIVDASTYTLFDKLNPATEFSWIKSRPSIIIDHHATVENKLDFTNVQLVEPGAASTGQIIFDICITNNWAINQSAAEHIMSSILGDTQGLTNDLTSAKTYRTMAALTDLGANRPKLEEARREYGKMAEKIYRYKGTLITRTEFFADGRIAFVQIPQQEINDYSPLYNPAPLIQFDMLQVRGVVLAIVIKTYDDGRITGALRGNVGYPVCGKLAEHLNGGGHDYAAGFKITDGRPYNEIKSECLRYATELLNNVTESQS